MQDIITSRAFATFARVAASIEAREVDNQLTLAAAGILPDSYRAFALAYVAKTSGILPKQGQRGLTYEKDSTEYNRVKYLVDVLTGRAAVKADKRSKSVKTDLEKALEAFAKLSGKDKAKFLAMAK
jgi:hypothetical protein